MLHPNEKGYAIWAEAMEPTIEKLLEGKSEHPVAGFCRLTLPATHRRWMTAT